jgi:hypothetical protein
MSMLSLIALNTFFLPLILSAPYLLHYTPILY